jgi:hypothetical protein
MDIGALLPTIREANGARLAWGWVCWAVDLSTGWKCAQHGTSSLGKPWQWSAINPAPP